MTEQAAEKDTEPVREYERSEDQVLDEAITNAIKAAEEAGASQLAKEFRDQRGYLFALRGK